MKRKRAATWRETATAAAVGDLAYDGSVWAEDLQPDGREEFLTAFLEGAEAAASPRPGKAAGWGVGALCVG